MKKGIGSKRELPSRQAGRQMI